jgi:very-short-patch-repair endonuclease
MDRKTKRTLFELAKKQHGVASRGQLLGLGLNNDAVDYLIATDFLHPIFRGVHAVGRRELTRYGTWMAAVLSCGPTAVLAYRSAGALWKICEEEPGEIEILIRGTSGRRKRDGRVIRTRTSFKPTRQRGIPVTTPIDTLIDLGTCLPSRRLEAAVSEADARGIVKVPTLHEAVHAQPGRPGTPALRALLDPATFVLTQSELERLFVPIARRAGLPKPTTQKRFGKMRVDFYWGTPLCLVVEVDGLTYHRTAERQAKDTARDHAHFLAGRTPLRFTHHQVAREPAYVETILKAAVERILRTRAA